MGFKSWVQARLKRALIPFMDGLFSEYRKSNLPVLLELRKLSDAAQNRTNPLLAVSQRYFSQNDEDGILLEIVRRIKVDSTFVFLELGVGKGTENNSIILLSLGWTGVWVGVEDLAFELSSAARLVFVRQWITKENATQLAESGLSKIGYGLRDVRVASVDLDGNDPHVVRRLLSDGLRPDVFVVEYNAKFPPNVDFEMPYNEKANWDGSDFFGASLQSWTKVFAAHQFSLVACNENGVNAYFVRNDLMRGFSDIPTEINKLYRPGHYCVLPRSGHRTSPRTVQFFAENPRADR
jgi:hypothetical protein